MICTAFVIAARNNLQVCAADVSTAFLCGKTREKVHIVAGPEFGEDAGKILIVEGGCYSLKTSAARFHEQTSAELRAMGFKPSKADFDSWMHPKKTTVNVWLPMWMTSWSFPEIAWQSSTDSKKLLI